MAHVRDFTLWTLVTLLALPGCGFKVSDFIAPNSQEAKKQIESSELTINGPASATEDDAIDLSVDTSKVSGTGAFSYKWSVDSINGTAAPALASISFTGSSDSIHFKAPQATDSYTAVLRVDVTRNGVTLSRTKAIAVTAIDNAPTVTIPDVSGASEGQTINLSAKIVDPDSPTVNVQWQVVSVNCADRPGLNVTNVALGNANTKTVSAALPQWSNPYTVVLSATVSDGKNTPTPVTKTINVSATDNNPTISKITDRSTAEATAISNIGFTIADEHLDTIANQNGTSRGNVTASATDSSYISNISISGSGANRLLSITPAAHKFGSTQINVQVFDEAGHSASTHFMLTISNVNEKPYFTKTPSNQTINQDTNTGDLEVDIDDFDSGASSLTLTAASSNPSFATNVTGSNGTRYVRVTPQAGVTGNSTITLTVSDGALSATASFAVTVAATNKAPTIAAISDQMGRRGMALSVPIAVSDAETATKDLTVTVTSSNADLVRNNKNSLHVDNNNTTLVLQPESARGSSTITVTVSDAGGLTASTSFTYTVGVADNFNRADQSGLGTSSSGVAWNTNVGDGDSIGIVSNRAQCASTGSTASCSAVIDTGESDGTYKIKIADYQNTAGAGGTVTIYFRRQDRDNTYLVSIPADPTGTMTVTERQGGGNTDHGSVQTGFAAGDTVQIDMSGANISVKLLDSSGNTKGAIAPFTSANANLNRNTLIGFRANIQNGNPASFGNGFQGSTASVSFDDMSYIP